MQQKIVIKEREISYILIDGSEYFNLTEIGSLDEESRDDFGALVDAKSPHFGVAHCLGTAVQPQF